MSMRVVSFGEILFDIIEGVNYLGGAPLNFAAHLAKCGVDSYIFSRVGEDELGEMALEQVKALGVKTEFIEKDSDHPTGTVAVALKKDQPDYTIFEQVAYDFISFEEAEKCLLEADFDVLYIGTLAQRNEHSKRTLAQLVDRKKFKHIFFDINLRKGFYSKEILHNSLNHCTILKMNDEEVKVPSAIFFEQDLSMEDFSYQMAKKYAIEVVVITAGAKGCLVYEKGKLNFVKGYPAQVVDTVGAGDSFSAAFLFQYFKYQNPLEAADIANQLGAFVASSRGPIPKYSPEIIQVLALQKAV